MSNLQTIPIQRLSVKDIKTLDPYIEMQQPVIITDLYDNSPIQKINTLELAIQEFGDVEIRLGKNYYDKFFSGTNDEVNHPDQFVLLRDYLALINKNPSTDLYGREQMMPEKMLNYFEIPQLVKDQPFSNAISKIYMANHGLIAPLHYDQDQREQ
jgi:hypothetical protein